MDRTDLIDRFVAESNAIEGIVRRPTKIELESFTRFIDLNAVTVSEIERFVGFCAPGAKLRDRPGMNVSVGEHHPPVGGPKIAIQLEQLVVIANSNALHPYWLHVEYETLHPFMDGNGRSGRALWAWQMTHHHHWPGIRLGFLHSWYYQSLEWSRRAPKESANGRR